MMIKLGEVIFYYENLCKIYAYTKLQMAAKREICHGINLDSGPRWLWNTNTVNLNFDTFRSDNHLMHFLQKE
jgi:hypothetical protein